MKDEKLDKKFAGYCENPPLDKIISRLDEILNIQNEGNYSKRKKLKRQFQIIWPSGMEKPL